MVAAIELVRVGTVWAGEEYCMMFDDSHNAIVYNNSTNQTNVIEPDDFGVYRNDDFSVAIDDGSIYLSVIEVGD